MKRAVIAALVLFAFVLICATVARHAYGGMLGGVGQLMIPGQLQANPVFPTFYITTGTGDPLTTGSGSRLVTGNAP